MTAPEPDLFRLDGRVVVITGGLGQLGLQFARAVLRQGGSPAILDVADEAAAASLLPEAAPGRLLYRQADVTVRESLESALDAVCSRLGRPSGLINNAALDSPPGAPAGENGPFELYPEASWDRVMEVNVKGVMLASQVFGGAMARGGGGAIVNVASIYGLLSPDQRIYEYRRQRGEVFFKPVAYTASKSALIGLTKYLATYFAPRAVRVNALSPGGVFNGQDPEFLRGYCAKVPVGRMARADEYNGAVVFLLSDASSYMTGANLVADGGFSAW